MTDDTGDRHLAEEMRGWALNELEKFEPGSREHQHFLVLGFKCLDLLEKLDRLEELGQRIEDNNRRIEQINRQVGEALVRSREQLTRREEDETT